MSKEIELNDFNHMISSAGEEEEDITWSSSAPPVVQSSVDEKRIRHEQSNQPQEVDEELTAFVEHDTTSINISHQEEENLDKIGPFISKIFPTAYQQLLTSEEATDHVPPKNKSVSLLSYKKRSAPNGCETGGTWGTTKYFGFNSCIMSLVYASCCGPYAFCVICCCPQDRRLAYLVNGKIYDKNGDLVGKEEDLIFQPRVEELVGQTISR